MLSPVQIALAFALAPITVVVVCIVAQNFPQGIIATSRRRVTLLDRRRLAPEQRSSLIDRCGDGSGGGGHDAYGCGDQSHADKAGGDGHHRVNDVGEEQRAQGDASAASTRAAHQPSAPGARHFCRGSSRLQRATPPGPAEAAQDHVLAQALPPRGVLRRSHAARAQNRDARGRSHAD